MPNLAGRTAIIFGAGSSASGDSNGKAACLAYARAGASVVCVDHDMRAVSETARHLSAEGSDHITVQADVRNEADIANAVEVALKRFGAIDILHNNVGILALGGPEDLSLENWNAAMEVNARGVFLSCRQVLPHMVERGRGAIVNISSIAGWRWCGRSMSGYSASKAAINQLTQEVAVAYAPHGIRCNAVVPGLINTPMVVGAYADAMGGKDAMVAQRDALCPMGRMGNVWEVAAAAVFLASDEASYISGALLPVDGALSCQVFSKIGN